ncbi:VOC family protein [Aliisedimentitalea scapharcae]|uniref:VOC family protein n=1 Tax=Aliisedimentitalea scapharcae TaxID=1524259 RepID=A0ABZ2XRB4_9RHOB|nr:VOC family protein [Rhodobacteraceae bacterium M382]
MTLSLTSLDHLVLTVKDIDRTIAFYTETLGMTAEIFHPLDGTTRHALRFGSQKINLHPHRHEFSPKAATPCPGTADLCFLSTAPLQDWLDHLAKLDISIIEGPVPRTGAAGGLQSIYIRDPDGNLLEISNRRC